MCATRVLASVCLAVVLTGCSASVGADESGTGAQPAPVHEDSVAGGPPRAGQEIPAPQTPQDLPAAQHLPAAQRIPVAQRQVVRDATVELRVDDVAEATELARQIGPDYGGFVAAEDSTAGNTSLTLRVASAELDAALSALGKLGEVTSRTLGTQDVTEETVDLDARIDSQRASVQRVRALLDRASTIGEVVQVESELTWREAELESLQQRAAALADQVTLATVRVRLVGQEAAAATAGFGSGLAGGWDALRSAGRVALLVLGAVLPFAAVLALPVAATLVWYRRRRGVSATTG